MYINANAETHSRTVLLQLCFVLCFVLLNVLLPTFPTYSAPALKPKIEKTGAERRNAGKGFRQR